MSVIRQLPEAIRSRLALENDEYSYSAAEILEVCRAARVQLVFYAHRHIVIPRYAGSGFRHAANNQREVVCGESCAEALELLPPRITRANLGDNAHKERIPVALRQD